jgi:hypothetical protein
MIITRLKITKAQQCISDQPSFGRPPDMLTVELLYSYPNTLGQEDWPRRPKSFEIEPLTNL